MPKIVFRGKTYNSVFDMPNDIRAAYQIEKRRHPESSASKPLTDFVEMSDEIRKLYERAMGSVEESDASSQKLRDLPRTEDIFRQSAPESMKHLPSDESVYRPSPPLVPPSQPAIEPDNPLRRFILTLGVLVLLIGIAVFMWQYLF